MEMGFLNLWSAYAYAYANLTAAARQHGSIGLLLFPIMIGWSVLLLLTVYVWGLLIREKYCIRAGTAEKMIFALISVMRENNTVYASTSPIPKPQSQSITNQQTLCMCQSEDVALYLLYIRKLSLAFFDIMFLIDGMDFMVIFRDYEWGLVVMDCGWAAGFLLLRCTGSS